MGEPAGIGTEITLKSWQFFKERHRPGDRTFFLVDDPVRLAKAMQALNVSLPIVTISTPEEATTAFANGLPVLPLSDAIPDHTVALEPGKPVTTTAKSVIHSIRQSVSLALSGKAAGVVTNPIQKKILMDDGFKHPGHTEFLGELTKDAPLPEGMMRGPVMLLAGADLKVAPVTVHMPLSKVPAALSPQMIAAVSLVVVQSLTRDFGISAPRLAVSGLNPHAGEGGALGQEDDKIIAPAIAELRKNGIDAIGPLPADTMFHEEARAQYHAAITMYHDQGLIPVKTIAFHSAANITLGLPIVRTSPDHGTGLQIAGKGVARADSMITAISAAASIAEMRAKFDAAFAKGA
jgi:4-hydroxythreonine-4-phosphate dehydrogenase